MGIQYHIWLVALPTPLAAFLHFTSTWSFWMRFYLDFGWLNSFSKKEVDFKTLQGYSFWSLPKCSIPYMWTNQIKSDFSEGCREPPQPFKSHLVEFSEVELILVSSTVHIEVPEIKLGQPQSGLCQNLGKCYYICKTNKDIGKWTGVMEMVLEKWGLLRSLQASTWLGSKIHFSWVCWVLAVRLQSDPI